MAEENEMQQTDPKATRPLSPVAGRGVLRPRARILRTFGDELISSEIVAIMELVKNSYDADATRVLVRFQGPLEAGLGKIEVVDNGHGMSLETIRTTWMEPATLMRTRQRLSRERGRRVLGEKGIGRFATSRLADFLEVVTRSTGSERQTRVFFDWAQFDSEDKYLDQVEVLWEEEDPREIAPNGIIERLRESQEVSTAEDSAHGTILTMEGLRSAWDTAKFTELRNNLSRLISPFFGEELSQRDDEFEVRLDLPPSFEHQSGIVDPPELLRNPHYSLQGSIDGEGNYDLKLRLRDSNRDEPIRGKFKIGGHEPRCGPIRIEIRVWDRDQASMSDLRERFSLGRTSEVRNQLDAASGVSIYRDGFRVLPFGEPDDDWLRLDLRRVQNPTLRLSNNQVLGYVLISSEANRGLRDQSNREGLIESPSLEDLRELIRTALSVLETRRYDFRHPSSSQSPQRKGGFFVGFSLAAVQNYARQSHPDDVQLTMMLGEAEKDLEERARGIQQVLFRYHRLASLGQLIDIVLHDGRAPLAKIGNEATLGLREVKYLLQDGVKTIAKLESRLNAIVTHSDFLATIFRRIEPFGGRRRGRPSPVSLEEVIAAAFLVLDTEIGEVGVNVGLPQTNTVVTVDQVEIQEVVINLLQNSLHWLRQVPYENREVSVEVDRKGSEEVEVVFADSGPGVPDEFRERIFDPYFSTKPEGVGLGLAIAGEIVTDYYAGVLELLDSGPLSGASFRFTLCRRV